MSASKSGFSQLPHGFHKRLVELTGAQLKVWIAHRCMEGKAGESYPSRARLVEYTGLNLNTVTASRSWLRRHGWLTSSGQKHTSQGKFSIPIEHTTIPEAVDGKPSHVAGAKTVDGKPTHGAGRKPSHGADGKTVDGLPSPEVDPCVEVDPNKVEGERSNTQNQNPSPSLPAALKPSHIESKATPKSGTHAQAVDYVIERAKSLSNGKASVSKTAKRDLLAAIQKIGNVKQGELIAAIEAKLKLCSSEDPTSYVIFGSSLASDLVASVKNIRERNEAAEYVRLMAQWKDKFLAAAEDWTVDLDDWCNSHRSAAPRTSAEDERRTELIEYGYRLREELLQKQNQPATAEISTAVN